MANPVCYGDIVFVDLKDKLLYSNGFFDPKVYLISKDNITLKAFRSGLFKLYPNFSYKDTSQADYLKDQLGLLKSLNPDATLAYEQLETDLKGEQEALAARDAKLDLLNEKIFKELKGKPIKYGQKVQLFHLESQAYVCPSKIPNQNDIGMLNIELTKTGSKNIYFKFMPTLGFIQEGEVVEYNLPLQVVCIKTESPIVEGSGDPLDLTKMQTEINPATNILTNNADFPPIQPRRKEPLFQMKQVSYTGLKSVEVPDNTYIRRYLTLQDQEELKKKKTLTNGDYIRITNDKVFLTAYPGRNSDEIYFQGYGDHQDQRFSNIYTLFQIVEVGEGSQKEKTFNFDFSSLPRGIMLEYNENKRYLLKHVISGKFLTFDKDTGLKLVPASAESNQNIQKISVILKNKSKDIGGRYLDRNSIMQLRFLDNEGKDHGILSIGKGIKLPPGSMDTNTEHFFGFQMTDNYLNKSLRTERFTPRVKPSTDDKTSSLKFIKINAEENSSILLGESLANQFGKSLDFMNDFLKDPNASLTAFNDEIKKLSSVCKKFEKEMYEEEYNESEVDILTPSKLMQNLLREFRIYDMLYRVFFYTTQDGAFLKKVNEIRQKMADEPVSRTATPASQKRSAKKASVQIDDIADGKDINFENLLSLFKTVKKLILISFKKNPLNRAYCSQFIRILINNLLCSDFGLFSLSPFRDKMTMKEITLAMLKKGLWDEDLDALGQLNFYEEPLFKAIFEQLTFHTLYLRLMEHISRSKAPNLDNKIRINFMLSFLSKDENIEHTFPRFVEEGDKIMINFNRNAHPEKSYIINLEDLDEKHLDSDIQDTIEADKIRITTTYLLNSLQLLSALTVLNVSIFNLMIVRYYRYDTLMKAINIIKNSSQHRQIRQTISEIINSCHQKFFLVPYTKLPMKLQVLNEDLNMKRTLLEADSFIKRAVDTSLSPSEVAYMKSEDIFDLIHPLKSVITSDGDLVEVIRLLKSNPSAVKNLEEARVVIEEVEKVLETVVDIDLEFLKCAHEVMINLIREAVAEKKKIYYDFIKQALEVFTLIEGKMVSYAATDIITSLQNNKLLGRNKSSDTNYNSPLTPDLNASSMSLKPLKSKKISPTEPKSKELSTKYGLDNAVLSNAIGAFSKEWKTGQRLYGGETIKFNKMVQIEESYKEQNTANILSVLLNISLLNDDHLLAGVIEQLRRIASYESILYTELSKLTIIHDSNSLNQAVQVIKSTFRINEINREVLFCKDKGITIDQNRMDDIISEVMDHLWKFFFTIYDPEKHFRYSEAVDAKQRFQDAFMKHKGDQFEIGFKLNKRAINRPFQKIFTILKVYRPLLKTIFWFMEVGNIAETNRYPLRLIIMIITAYVSENRENQELFSNLNEFIKMFYAQKFISHTCDTILVFSEIIKGNKKLLKLPMKHLYDITVSTLIGTLTKSITDNESNAYLSSTIGSFEFLSKSLLPEEIFNPLADLKERWQQISDVEAFKSLNVINYRDEVSKLPFCYYSVRETIEVTLKSVESFAENSKTMNEIQMILPFSSWLGFFESENYLLQYELKNMVAKCIGKIYFEFGKKGKFLQKFEECSSMMACLVSDILFFRTYNSIKESQDSVRLRELIEIPSFLTTHEQYENLKKLYGKNPGINFETKKLQIYFEDISLHKLLYEYVYGGCIDLLFNLLLQEVDSCTQAVDRRADTKTIMDFILLMLDEFIQYEGRKENFPYQKFEKFLNDASVTRGFEIYKDKIIALTNKLIANRNKGCIAHKMIVTLHEREINITPLDSYNQHLESLRKYKSKLKEQNIKEVADNIAQHPNADDIISQIMKYLKKDLSKLSMDEIKFLLRVLRKYIERENSNNKSDDPVYKWKDVSLSDLKKIGKIQSLYMELGLTELLFSFLSLSDEKVFRESLLLALAYMYGGNSKVQEEFFNCFTDDDENLVIAQLSDRLKSAWLVFRAKEGERMFYLYSRVQKNLFDYMKEKSSAAELIPDQIQIKAFETDIDQKYLEYAETYKSNKIFMLILNFLQSLCEGQYTDMQRYLKEQKWKGRTYPKSFDFLGFLRQCINSYHKVLNRYNLSVGGKVLELITEVIQGDVVANISVFLNKSFIYDMCRIVTDYNTRYHTLPRGFGLDPFHEEFRQIKSQVIFVFKLMLENRNEDNLAMLSCHLDTMGLMTTFNNLMKNFVNKKGLQDKVTKTDKFIGSLANEDFKDTLGDAINIYIIYRYLYEDSNTFADNMRGLIDGVDKADQNTLGKIIFNLFKKLVTSIEMIADTKSEPLIRVWFPIIAVCNYISQDTQASFLNNVDRDNSQTKIMGLVEAAQEFIPQMEADYKARNKLFGFNFKFVFTAVRLLTNLIGLAVTGLNIGTYKINWVFEEEEVDGVMVPTDTKIDAIQYQDDEYTLATEILNYIQIGLAGTLVIFWFLFFRSRHQSVMWERFIDENAKETGLLPPTVVKKLEDDAYNELDENDCKLIMLLKGANSDEFQAMRQYAPRYKEIQFDVFLRNLLFVVSSGSFIWHLIYLGITIGSIFHPIVAIFQIFDIAIRSTTIAQISSAISRNAGQFVWTLFLLVVVNIVYSSLGFYFYNLSFIIEDNVLCSTAFSCFMNTLNLGLRSGGGIADAIGPLKYADNNVGAFVGRVIFDLTFFIIMIILLLNLIFGMIIDAFGDLRDQKTSNDEDHKNVCFICGIGRSDFERHTNFEAHILYEHEMWAYLYYIIYLLDKQKTAKVEMTDIENLVIEKYMQKNLDWFPIGQSLTLKRITEAEQTSAENDIEKLTKKVESIQKNVLEVDSKLANKIEQILGFVKK